MAASKRITVKGEAIRAGLSLNKILYLPEELAKFAPTLNRRPILKDHISRTDNTIGKISSSLFDNASTEVRYGGWVKEDGTGIIERIQDHRIEEVSIGAVVGRLVKQNLEDDFFIAKDIRGLELSTTPTPATVGTSIRQSLKELKEAKTPEELKKVKPILENFHTINSDYGRSAMPAVAVAESTEASSSQQTIIQRFACPLCEADLQSVEELRKHMKAHNEERREVGYEESADMKRTPQTSVTDQVEEVNTMAEENAQKEYEEKLKALEAREAKVKEQEGALESKVKDVEKKQASITAKESELAKERHDGLVAEYNKVAEEKKIVARDVSKLSDETVKELIEQLKVVETPVAEDDNGGDGNEGESDGDKKDPTPAEEPKKDETVGKVKTTQDAVETDDGYVVERSEFGSGFSLYTSDYDSSKYKRLAR